MGTGSENETFNHFQFTAESNNYVNVEGSPINIRARYLNLHLIRDPVVCRCWRLALERGEMNAT